jgi:hypothetical protein
MNNLKDGETVKEREKDGKIESQVEEQTTMESSEEGEMTPVLYHPVLENETQRVLEPALI